MLQELTGCRRLCPIFESGGSEGPLPNGDLSSPTTAPHQIIPTAPSSSSAAATAVTSITDRACPLGSGPTTPPSRALPSTRFGRLRSELPPARPPPCLRLKRPKRHLVEYLSIIRSISKQCSVLLSQPSLSSHPYPHYTLPINSHHPTPSGSSQSLPSIICVPPPSTIRVVKFSPRGRAIAR